MKSKKYILLLVVIVLSTAASAKSLKTNRVYMFGFSASFKDSVVYVTDIQNPQGVWIESKNKFLLNRDEYSYQLNNYLSEKLQLPQRVCMVLFAFNKKKAEKLYLKLMKKYKKGYEIRYLNVTDFKFETIDLTPEEE